MLPRETWPPRQADGSVVGSAYPPLAVGESLVGPRGGKGIVVYEHAPGEAEKE
jgi:hypothetical protein